MTKNYFKSIRRSYAVNILFSAVLSNLTAFGQPLQQILSDKQHSNTVIHNYYGSYSNHDIPNPGTVATDKVKAELHEYKTSVNQPSHIGNSTGYRVFFAGEDTGVIGNLYGAGDENPDDNYFTVILPDNINLEKHTVLLAYDVYGLQDASHTTKSINYHPSYGGRAVATGNSWKSVSEIIPASQLVKGTNEIFFNKRTDTTYQYQVKNLRIELQPKTDKAFTLSGQHLVNYNGTVYVSGIASDASITSVNAGSKQLTLINGFLEDVITNVSRDVNSLDISYTGANGEIIKTKYNVLYTTENIAHNFTESGLSRNLSVYNSHDINKGAVNFENSLTISNLCADNNSSLVIAEGLSFKDIRTLNSDLTNVTGGNYRAYNIKKSYVSDANPVQLHLKYNPEAIPDGYTAKDIRTYYFDKNLRAWKELATDSLDYSNNEIITSIYDNDTDYINGVIKVPDSPESGSFAPTTITDMKVADPAAGVVSIPPPTPNSTGNATTGFPIKLPQGRNGMQPSLEVTYNSEAGNGWMGIGWNLSIPAITLNTKWGAPLFNTSTETELYLLNGADLVLKAGTEYTSPHRQANITRAGEREFYMRKEGAYNKIIRHGDGPGNYSWEVIDKQGNKSFYGNYNGSGDAAIISNGKIAYWALKRTQDPYGNFVEYTYENTLTQSPLGTTLTGQHLYIKTITYTRHNNNGNYYKIDFTVNQHTLPQGSASAPEVRNDNILSLRNGYAEYVKDLLTEIKISLVQNGQTQAIRSYGFEYGDMQFQKKQLKSITEYDSEGKLFYSNTLEYYRMDTGIISQSLSWSGNTDDPIPNPLPGSPSNVIKGSALGTSTSKGFSFGFRGGFGYGLRVWNIGTSLGGSFNYSSNTSSTYISLTDMNGDGLPDKVIRTTDGLYYRKNTGAGFGNLIPVIGFSNLSNTKSRTVGAGADAGVGPISAGKSWNKTKNETDNYFTDINGDGLADIITGGKVKFNITSESGNYDERVFDTQVALTENKITQGQISSDVLGSMQFETLNEIVEQNPQFDHIKMWEAPYNGTIQILPSTATLINKNVDNVNHPNSFRISIEKGNATATTGNASSIYISTASQLSSPNNFINVAQYNSIAVSKGDRIFFRIHNFDKGYGGKVEWNPVINYTAISYSASSNTVSNIPTTDLNMTDENGKAIRRYESYNDFILNNHEGTGVSSGTTSVTATFGVPSYGSYAFSENVRFNIKLYSENSSTAYYSAWREYNHKTGTYTSSTNVNAATGTITMGSLSAGSKYTIVAYAESTSNVRWENIKWKPTYTTVNAGITSGQKFIPVNYYNFDNNVYQKKYWIQGSTLPDPVISASVPNDANAPMMVLKHNYLDQNFASIVNDTNIAPGTILRANFVVKLQTNTIKTLKAKSFFLKKVSDSTFTISNDYAGNSPISLPLAPTDTVYSQFTLKKQHVKDLRDTSGRIYAAIYVSDKKMAFDVNSNINVSLSLAPGVSATYTTVTLPIPILSASVGLFGSPYRGWSQFLYNGGLSFPHDQEGNIPPGSNPTSYSGPIDLSIFSTESQQDQLEAFDMDNPPPAEDMQISSAPIRYANYGQDMQNNCYVNASVINASHGLEVIGGTTKLVSVIGRFGEANVYDVYVDPNTVLTSENGVFKGLKQRTESKGSSVSAGATFAEGTESKSTSRILNQYIDLNGDRYPDLVTGNKIQYTNLLGAFSTSDSNNFIPGDSNIDKTFGVTIPCYQPNSTETTDGGTIGNKTISNINSGINTSNGHSFDSDQWADINGDGLPDKIRLRGNKILVCLNKGYSFTNEIEWIHSVQSELISSKRDNQGGGANMGAGITPSSSYAVGTGIATSLANMNTMFTDVNGDGLADLIIRTDTNVYSYYLNKGDSFDSQATTLYNGLIERDTSISGNVFGAFTYGFPITLLALTFKVTLTPSGGASTSVNQKEATLQDINGDGLPDVLTKGGTSSNGNLSVVLNTVGKTHLLKKVNTPLGGSWTIDYTRSTNSYKMPNSKWMLTLIETHDGFEADNTLKLNGKTRTAISYGAPNYDRRERQFLGFDRVTIEQKNITSPYVTFRYTEKLYHNENYYLSGAERSSALYTPGGQVLTQQTTLYNLLNPDTPVVNLNPDPEKSYMQQYMDANWKQYIDGSRLFLAPVRIISSSYEGTNGLNAAKEFLEYDGLGNIKKFLDRGENEADAYRTEITYLTPANISYGNGFPQKISVYKNNNNQLMRQREAEYTNLGKLSKATTKLNDTDNRIVTFEYDSFGNMVKYRDNDNPDAANAAYFIDLTYDDVLQTYPVKVKNSFLEESRTVYNYLFGIPVLTTDVNRQKMRTRIDTRGRIIEVTGPNEMAAENNGNGGWTIRTEYKGEDMINQALAAADLAMQSAKGKFEAVLPGTATPTGKQHFAVTKHFDPEITGNQFITISIVDGFGEPLQVKKTHITDTNTLKWLISGPEEKDAFGRTTKTYDPIAVATSSTPTTLSDTADKVYATPSVFNNGVTMTYDLRDRLYSTQQAGAPANQVSVISYTIAEGMFKQKQLNEEGHFTETYTDIRGRQRKVSQQGTLNTTFTYNAINELTKVTNNEGNVTEYTYDLAGRKTKVCHPDKGVNTFKYNKAGNVTEQTTANLTITPTPGATTNYAIKYGYDAGRLISVTYPSQRTPENNVTYTYGRRTDSLSVAHNAVGRLLYQKDGTGTRVFAYGRMGEVTKNLQSVNVAGSQPYWFFTQWKYDSWNRVQEITYPDQEVVSYSYNRAGALNGIASLITSTGFSNTTHNQANVVTALTYNDLGLRKKITYGNGTSTDYTYDGQQKLSTLKLTATGYAITKQYEYYKIPNIKSITTLTPSGALPSAGKLGGPVTHNYAYDNYNRLISANGAYTGLNDSGPAYSQHNYTLAMEYNTNHTLKKKTQVHTLGPVAAYGDTPSPATTRQAGATSYTLDYSGYATGAYAIGQGNTSSGNYGWQQPHAVRKVKETPNLQPGQSVTPGDLLVRYKEISYDAGGNQTQVKEKVGGKEIVLRKYAWDEEERLMGADLKPDDPTNRPTAIYTYNAAGERTVRHNFDRSDVYTNSAQIASGYRDNIMLYPSGLLMAKVLHLKDRKGDRYDQLQYTKHYYIGAERISAKPGSFPELGYFPVNVVSANMPALANGVLVNTTQLRNTLATAGQANAVNYVKKVHAKFTPVILLNLTAATNAAPGITNIVHTPAAIPVYYFHPDHLGSSSYVTGRDGKVTQHMEYLPFGETLTDEHINSKNSPFKYNGKEYDEETGNYYYGARYYDPKLSIFMSVDPLVEKTFSSYGYCYNNPIRFTDPNGKEPTPYEAALMASHVYSNSGPLAGGWALSSLGYYNTIDEPSGLKGAMYERKKENGQIEYSFVFAGTEDIGNDGYEDLAQIVGESLQYEQAGKLATQMSDYIGDQELTFVGHSLGGGLANFSSILTGRSALSLNPAWIAYMTLNKYRSQMKKLKKGKHRNSYVHESDPLHRIQLMLGWSAGLTSDAKYNEIEGGFWSNTVTGHLIGTLIGRMQSNGEDRVHKANGDDTIIHANPRDF